MRIAVLSSNYISTCRWLRSMLDHRPGLIRKLSEGTFQLGEDIYCVVRSEEQLRGLQIDMYIKAPDYHTLEDVAKERMMHSRY